MTEAEWLACEDVEPMLRHLKGAVGERKFRLTECAFMRRFWHLLSDPRSRRAVEVDERVADGEATRDELREACAAAEAAFDQIHQSHFSGKRPERPYYGGSVSAAQHAAFPSYDMPEWFGAGRPDAERFRTFVNLQWYGTPAFPLAGDPPAPDGPRDIDTEGRVQADLLRDIFGNPFRPAPPSLGPARLPPAVVALAQSIYDARAFDRMPELADALERAGCADADVLAHCRGQRPEGGHVRGCWVVDAILGKS
ncbi:MAG: hypothetical protein ACAI43_02790 [Phycisphaerae bacterium]